VSRDRDDELVAGAAELQLVAPGQRQGEGELEAVGGPGDLDEVGPVGLRRRVVRAVQLLSQRGEVRQADGLARAVRRDQHRQAAGVGAHGGEMLGLRGRPAGEERLARAGREDAVRDQRVDPVAVQRQRGQRPPGLRHDDRLGP
jgi:hypothetical protein